MYHDFFAKSPLLALPLAALVLFVAVFAMIILRTFAKKEREAANAASLLPLEDDAEPSLVVATVGSTRSEGRHE